MYRGVTAKWAEYARGRRVVYAADLKALGLPRNLLSDLMRDEVLRWACPGVYVPSKVVLTYEERAGIIARKYPGLVFCLETVLWFRTTLLAFEPKKVWVAAPRGQRLPKLDCLKVGVVRMPNERLGADVDPVPVCGVEARMFSVVRTAVDCFKYREEAGLWNAEVALRFVLDAGHSRAEVLDLAKRARVERSVRRAVASWLRGDPICSGAPARGRPSPAVERFVTAEQKYGWLDGEEKDDPFD